MPTRPTTCSLRLKVSPRDDENFTAIWIEDGGQESNPFDLHLPLTRTDAAELRWYLEEYFRLPGPGDHVRAAGIGAKLEIWGRELFAALFGHPEGVQVYNNLMQAEVRQITIAGTEPRLLIQPWELMRDKQGPLAFRGVALRRQLIGAGLKMTLPELKLPLRVLLIVSRPTDAGFIDPRNNLPAIFDALEALPGQVRVDFCEPPTFTRLGELIASARKAGQGYHIVHFDGHGCYLPHSGVGALAFEKPDGRMELVSGRAFGDLLSRTEIPLALLDACQGADLSSRPVFGSVAPALLEAGVGSVLAYSHSVHIRASQLFTARFYQELVGGASVGQALQEARTAIFADRDRPLHQGPEAKQIQLQDWFIPQLYQIGPDPALVSSGRKSRAEPPRHWRTQLHNFPPEPRYRFYGRVRELLGLERAFRGHGAVLLHGMGGMGKTALAREAAAWWLRTGRIEAAVFFSFESLAGAERAVQVLGGALEGEAFSSLEAREQWRRGVELFHERRVLVVWDNFESTLAAFNRAEDGPLGFDDGARARLRTLYDDLIQGSPRGRLLITSRVGESYLGDPKEVELEGLARVDSLSLLGAVLDRRGIEAPEQPEGEWKEGIIRLLDLLGDHPLSIELVGPHLREYLPDEICGEFGGLLDEFTDDAAMEDRNRSLKASLAFSSRHLGAGARAALPQLAWFSGGVFEHFFLDVSELPGDAWVAARAELEGLALIQVERVDWFNTPYLQLHPTLPYAADPDPGRDRRFVAVYAAVADLILQTLRGSDPAVGMALGRLEEANLRRALGLVLVNNLREETQFIAETLDVYLQMSARMAERGALAEWVRSRLPVGVQLDMPACAAIQNNAWSRLQREDAVGAVEEMEQLIRRIEGDGLVEGGEAAAFQLVIAHGYLGRILYTAGRADLAVGPIQQAVAGFEGLEQTEAVQGNLAAALGDLANAQRHRGELDGALVSASRYLEISEALGRKREIAAGHGLVAQILLDQVRYAEAEVECQRALQAAREVGDGDLEATFLQHMGILKDKQRSSAAAVAYYRQALALFQAAGNEVGEMQTCNQLGSAELRRAQLDAAEAWYVRSRELAVKLQKRRQLAVTSQNLGILYQTRSEAAAEPQRSNLLRRAVELVGEGLQIEQEMHNLVGEAASQSQLGILFQMLGKLDQAEGHVRKALEIRERLNLPEVWKDYDNLAEIARARGDEPAAAAWQARRDAKVAELEGRARGGAGGQPAGLEGLSPALYQVMVEVCQAVYAARRGARLDPKAGEELSEMAKGTEPWPQVAIFLRAAADPGQAVPAAPAGLPGDLTALLEELRSALV